MTAVASDLQRISRILPKQLNLDNSWQHIGNFYIKVLHPLSTSAGLIQNIYNLVPYLQPGVPIYNLVPYLQSGVPLTTQSLIYNQVSHLQPSPLFTITCPIYNLVPYLQPGSLFTTRRLPFATTILTLSGVVVPQPSLPYLQPDIPHLKRSP